MFLSDRLEDIDGIVLNRADMAVIDDHLGKINKAIFGLTGLQKVSELMTNERDFPGDNEEVEDFLRSDFYSGCIERGMLILIDFLADEESTVEELFNKKIEQCPSKQQRSSQG